MALVTCICGIEFESPRGRKYCSETCRKRLWRKGIADQAAARGNVRQLPLPKAAGKVARDAEALPEASEVGTVTDRVIAELVAADALESANGALAVKLAGLIDQADAYGGGGRSAAGWAKEMRAALAQATAGAPVAAEDDPIERRAKRRAGRAAG